jgi:RNase P subunit RPR2
MALFKKKYYCQNCNQLLDISENDVLNEKKVICDNCLTTHFFYTIRKGENLPIIIDDHKIFIIVGE